MSKQILLIFVKNAELGKVKTRLAATVGDVRALQIYKKLLHYTQQVTASVLAEKQVWYSNYVHKNDPYFNESYTKHIQLNGDLGQKMKYAFEKAFEKGADRVVVIGSDCAELTTEHLEDAFLKLKTEEIVIGPAKDGGYYLLGMNQYYPELLVGIPWSTAAVYEHTLDIAKKQGKTVFELSHLNDVDTIDDWQIVASKFEF